MNPQPEADIQKQLNRAVFVVPHNPISFASQDRDSALLGVFSFAKPIDTRGPKAVVALSLLLWIGIVAAAYFVGAKSLFWIVACTAGLGLGTIQAASRAFFTQFIPRGKEAEYFGVYSLVGKSSAIFGPLIFGEVAVSFGSQRPAILSIALFFLVGLVILFFVRGGGPNVKRCPATLCRQCRTPNDTCVVPATGGRLFP